MESSPEEGVPLERIEHTISIDAPPEEVSRHLTHVEGLGVTDAVASDRRGGRALLVVAPNAADGATLTMVADAPAESEARAAMLARMRSQLDRVAASLEHRGGIDGPVETGLDAIEEDLADGVREAPFADDRSHRP